MCARFCAIVSRSISNLPATLVLVFNFSLFNLIISSIYRISWTSKCQFSVALSSTEAEHLAMTCYESFFLKRLLGPMGFLIVPLTLHSDNQFSLALVRNLVLHSRTKHIDIGSFGNYGSLVKFLLITVLLSLCMRIV